jgi:hypothetical protein
VLVPRSDLQGSDGRRPGVLRPVPSQAVRSPAVKMAAGVARRKPRPVCVSLSLPALYSTVFPLFFNYGR